MMDAVANTDALFFGSNVLVGKAEAALAMAARERALELGRPFVFDPNIRLGRWDNSPGRAGAAAGACVPGAFLVKCNELEARLMTGETDPERGGGVAAGGRRAARHRDARRARRDPARQRPAPQRRRHPHARAERGRRGRRVPRRRARAAGA